MSALAPAPPVADWVTIADLNRDPFPIYERLRAEGGVHWVPSVNRYLITGYDAVHTTEFDQQTFSANEQGSLQIRAMGHSMLRRDDPEHYPERKAWQPVLRPGVVKRVWASMFETNANRYLDEMIEKGPGADVIWDFAAPYSAENLRQILGFHNATQQDLKRWSQTLIDATGNYADDPEIWARGQRSFDEVDVALDEMLAWHSRHPDHSLISTLLRIPDYEMPIEKIRANIKMTIGGGLNEPRDALGVAAWALLTHPEQRQAVEADPGLWGSVFDETLRWIAPIGLYSRQTTRDVVLSGVLLPAGARLGICILSANRDETVWPDAARFDIRREVKPHLAFSKGVHVCLGAWVARAEVAEVGLPLLFERLRGMQLSQDAPATIGGWVFRGMLTLPIEWSTASVAATPIAVAPPRTRAPRIAIVGSGPAGCFTAQALRRELPSCEIDVFDALPTPYGLVRYGVAADHQGTKSVARQFDRLFRDEGVRFHGNVRIGTDFSLEQLREASDSVVLATGLRSDRMLGVPGDDHPRVHGAGRLTRLLNGHPDETDAPALGPAVTVIGHGNVALDVVRLLARDDADFDGTDVDDAVRARIAARVRTIHVVGRSGPESAKFDPVMARELAGLRGIRHVVHGAGVLPDEGKDARADAVRMLAAAEPEAERVRIEWWFGLTPVRIDAEGGALVAVFSGEAGAVHLAVDDVITAVGFAADGQQPITSGASPDGRLEPGVYVAGWLRRGPRGTIPDQRSDARSLARTIVADLAASGIAAEPPTLPAIDGEVDFDGWRRIDLRERLGAAPGRERAKLRSIDELLSTARDTEIVLPSEIERDGLGISAGRPVTVLYASESGGAELVAGELAELVGAGEQLHDLADFTPDRLDPKRLHLIVCSTYGDGEVPTTARPFHRALRDERHALEGVHYAVFGMGDRSYARTYSRGSEMIDEALSARGAIRIGEYGRHDAGGHDEATDTAREWAAGILAEALALSES